ncbi:uncharacterized protein ARMOST_16766 [Armillaria ostoyae]|uniref:Uncharacterized protein n=1 Tax=Armillaria ostoyae TaxID=47428 RepID=A0A284RX35_ARMOS|nr:uncharacterized protein ARMOST_00173 [Armillaria ostoyae]SJL12638.1 uncharacterized protein ARMOST_16067 [Armillaria ostoyae]SJL12722.1 uncharacterized protein ARMOST_16153 [Armillaria ostoyae]SJL13326.1 uncharacterized protein ARMOST_16766 [Armillaria ostoyae]
MSHPSTSRDKSDTSQTSRFLSSHHQRRCPFCSSSINNSTQPLPVLLRNRYEIKVMKVKRDNEHGINMELDDDMEKNLKEGEIRR